MCAWNSGSLNRPWRAQWSRPVLPDGRKRCNARRGTIPKILCTSHHPRYRSRLAHQHSSSFAGWPPKNYHIQPAFRHTLPERRFGSDLAPPRYRSCDRAHVQDKPGACAREADGHGRAHARHGDASDAAFCLIAVPVPNGVFLHHPWCKASCVCCVRCPVASVWSAGSKPIILSAARWRDMQRHFWQGLNAGLPAHPLIIPRSHHRLQRRSTRLPAHPALRYALLRLETHQISRDLEQLLLRCTWHSTGVKSCKHRPECRACMTYAARAIFGRART